MAYHPRDGLNLRERIALRSGNYLLAEDALQIVASQLPFVTDYELLPAENGTDENGELVELYAYAAFYVACPTLPEAGGERVFHIALPMETEHIIGRNHLGELAAQVRGFYENPPPYIQ